jgi:hypothetical protein
VSVRILREVGKKLLEVIVLDATISHDLSFSKTVTNNPIEEGSNVTDHAQHDPTEISVTGIVTNTPVTLLSGGIVPTFVPSRSRTAYKALRQVFESDELVQIQDELDVFDSYMMSQLSIPRDTTNYNALQFTATFRKVVIVGTLTIALSEDAAEIAAPAENLGRVTPAAASPAAAGEASTLARLLF